MSQANNLKQELKTLANPQQASILQRFFKTAPGEYGEGDIFLGIKVPVLRKTAKKYKNFSLKEIEEALKSPIHEHRFIALVILTNQYKKADAKQKEKIFKFFLKNKKQVNNWDLVDCFAPNIIGDFLRDKDRELLYKLAQSKNLWQRRMAILATLAFIRQDDFLDCLAISEILLNDKHDLIHKAVGWMLREIGKKDQKAEEIFLAKHYQKMPRVMLRYAIEKFSQEKKDFYLGRV